MIGSRRSHGASASGIGTTRRSNCTNIWSSPGCELLRPQGQVFSLLFGTLKQLFNAINGIFDFLKLFVPSVFTISYDRSQTILRFCLQSTILFTIMGTSLRYRKKGQARKVGVGACADYLGQVRPKTLSVSPTPALDLRSRLRLT